MAAGKLDLIIEKGGKFTKHLEYKDKNKAAIDLTGYTARMQIRKNAQAASFILELTTENGRISITPLTGEIDLLITGADTAGITERGNAIYDLELVDAGSEPLKFLRGTVSFIEEVTR